MGNTRPRTQGIQRLYESGASYRAIARSFQCIHTTMAHAIHSDMAPFPAISQGQKKLITREISRYIEILSMMDAILSNAQITAKVQERWADLKIGKTAIHGARSKQDLPPEQRLRKCVLADMNGIAIDQGDLEH
jgi:hypothetical protein